MARCVLSFQLRFATSVTPKFFRGTTSRVFASSASSGVEKKRVVFLGTPEVAATTLKRLHEDSQQETSLYEIVSVITQPPRRRKRKGKLEPSPVGIVAEELGIPILHPEKVRTQAWHVEIVIDHSPLKDFVTAGKRSRIP